MTFRYQKVGSAKWRRCTLSALEFMRRFLQHVLPKGFVKVRHFGFLSPNFAVPLQKIRELICLLYERLQALPCEGQAAAKAQTVTLSTVLDPLAVGSVPGPTQDRYRDLTASLDRRVRTRRTHNPARTLSDRAAWRVGFVHFQGKTAPRRSLQAQENRPSSFFAADSSPHSAASSHPPRTRQPALRLNHFP